MDTTSQEAFFDSQLQSQWTSPSDILSLLLLVGGDVVQKALAQTAGRGLTPVAFSFGWVSYAFSALLAAVGDRRIMPDPDCSAIVVNTKNGFTRENRSWIIGRVVRDVHYWMERTPKDQLKALIERAQVDEDSKVEARNKMLGLKEKPQKIPKKGLCVLIYRAIRDDHAAVPPRRGMWILSFVVLLGQLALAAVPWGRSGQWNILLVTLFGTLLAVVTSLLPQWFQEKWSCRKLEEKKTFALTRGNGAQFVIIIDGEVGSYDFEDLAAGATCPDHITVAWFSCVLVLWTALLITVSGIKSNTWYLLGVGALGMLQNTITAGAPRHPRTYGIHLQHLETFVNSKVMGALMNAEVYYKKQLNPNGVVDSLVKIFFPGDLRPSEQEWFNLSVEQQETLVLGELWNQNRVKQKEMIEEVKAQVNNAANNGA